MGVVGGCTASEAVSETVSEVAATPTVSEVAPRESTSRHGCESRGRRQTRAKARRARQIGPFRTRGQPMLRAAWEVRVHMTTEAPVAPLVAGVGLGVRRMAPALGVLAKANTNPT